MVLPQPLSQNEGRWEAFAMKILCHFYANKTYFHILFLHLALFRKRGFLALDCSFVNYPEMCALFRLRSTRWISQASLLIAYTEKKGFWITVRKMIVFVISHLKWGRTRIIVSPCNLSLIRNSPARIQKQKHNS